MGKIKVIIRNWFCWCEEISDSLSEIISIKLGKNYKEIFWNSIAIFKRILRNFEENFTYV